MCGAADATVRGSMGVYRQPQCCPGLSDGDVAPRWQGAGRIRCNKWSAGFSIPQITSAELYDQTTGTWTLTGSLTDARVLHTAALLLNGQVLVAGGWPNHTHTGGALASAELYDPATGNWSFTGSMNIRRVYHTETLLLDGRVLVVGCFTDGFTNSAELYDPATGTWSFTGSTNTPRFGFHTATLLPSGMVLVAGGYDSNGHTSTSAELYDPATGNWTMTGSLDCSPFPHGDIAGQRKVLIAGGTNGGYWQARKSTTQPPAIGHRPATSTLPAGAIPQHCFPMVRCWSQVA